MDKIKHRQPLGPPVSHHSLDTKAQNNFFFPEVVFPCPDTCLWGSFRPLEKENQELSWLPDITATMTGNIFGHSLPNGLPKRQK